MNKPTEKYKKYKKKPWLFYEELHGIKFNIFQKLKIWIPSKYMGMIEYYKTNPYRFIEKYINKPCKRSLIFKLKK